MRRYGWDYDRGYRDREPRAFYDRGYRGGWGMAGLNNAFLYGPREDERGYDPPLRGRPRSRGYGRDFGSSASRGRERPSFRPVPWRSRYDGGWFF